MKTNLTQRMVSFMLAIVLLVGIMPTAAFATDEDAPAATTENVETVPVTDEVETTTEDENMPAENGEANEPVEDEAEPVITPAEENVVNVTADTTSEDIVSTNYGRTFRMPGKYYDFITSHERYGTCDYLAYVSGEELIIFFFDEDISDKEFVLWDVWGDDYASGFGARFGSCPKFTSYTYDKNTLELKRTTSDIYPLGGQYKFTYTYVSSFDVFWYRYNDPRFYDHAGSLPRIDIPNPPADAKNVTRGRNFVLPGDNLWVLQNCEEYGKKDYLAFVWEEIYVIWFFDDISDVKFYKWDFKNDLNHYFGIRPSRNIPFTKYTFNRSTLKFNEKEELMLNTNNLYGLNYTFDASIDIYWDNSYDRDNMFFDNSGTLPKIEVQNPPEDIWNVTSGRTFNMRGELDWLLQNCSEYGSKDYLAYEWNDDVRIWFFNDISNVKFTTYEKFGDNFANYFGIRPSANVTFTEYVYNKNTLKFKRVEERTFITSNGFTFMYPFTASFNIYTDGSYNKCFYDASRNWSDNPNIGEELHRLENKTGGNVFGLGGNYTRLIVNHSEYGKKDFLAHTLGGELVIIFFEDISNVKFTETSSMQFSYFYMKASQEIEYIQYTYDASTYKLKNVKPGTNDSLANLRLSYYFTASFDIYSKPGSYNQYFYRVNGDRPTLPSVEVSSIDADMDKFGMDEVYCNVIRECHEYRQGQRYLSYLWSSDFVIWFFDDPDIKFSAFEKWDGYLLYFGVNPSEETWFKAYVYDKNTLELKSESYNMLGKNNGYTITYRFVANIDIFRDETYRSYFYQGDEEVYNASSIFNVTNNETFSMPRTVYDQVKKLQKDDETLSNKNFLAYAWDDKNIIWFFDTPNMKAYVQDREVNTFGLVFPEAVQVTAFLYNRETGEFIEQSTFTVGKSSGYTFRHYFMADFSIYTNDYYTKYFYNAANNTVGKYLRFKPLSSQEAKEFLGFITNSIKSDDINKEFDNIDKELSKYYKYLTGNIDNFYEELSAQISFLDFCDKCMNLQLKSCGEATDDSETKLIKWLKEQDIRDHEKQDSEQPVDPKITFWTFVQSAVSDGYEALMKTIVKDTALELIGAPSISSMNDFLKYNLLIIDPASGIKAIRTIDNIQYLKAYKQLLDALDSNDEYSILLAEMNCSMVKLNMSLGGDIDEMQTYATYLYLIEKSLPEEFPF